MKRIFTFLGLLFCCNFCFSQEIAPEKETTYSFSLNKLKTQAQVTAIETATKNIEHVSSCTLDWLNYTMTVKVKEGGNLGSFSMEKLKAILSENNAALKTFKKESKQL